MRAAGSGIRGRIRVRLGSRRRSVSASAASAVTAGGRICTPAAGRSVRLAGLLALLLIFVLLPQRLLISLDIAVKLLQLRAVIIQALYRFVLLLLVLGKLDAAFLGELGQFIVFRV